ncbi:MAG: iron-containing alcohol dehydrogenase [Desulfobacterales bacterium]|nr:iron-containing alcohol dehydrogenase [Desulfobacterales bacterium]MBL7102300.1 iron-containing alcohol dehydrogenase [Desulfobacteraceae bacterium]MBL7171715.1 iron-containing alcohol dehydrogenase [Desulfobacteraceae bacterium]
MKKAFIETDKISIFLSPHKTILGKGVVQQLGKEVTALGGRKVLVVTDPGVLKAGMVEMVEKALVSEGIKMGLFDKVEPEPPVRVVDECVQTITEGKYDLIIGIGGGSALDVAKGAAAVAPNGGKVLDYVGIDTIPKKGLPKILIPTTAGTGSEATRVFVMTDETDNTKKVVYSNFLLSDVAMLDPVLTVSMPPAVTADTGLDALVHAIEAYVSVNTTPFAEILALEAISLIAYNLPIVFSKGSNIQARYNMLLAANLGGAAFTSGGLGAVHGLAYVLGTDYHMAHGRSNAIMLPHVMSFNMTGNLQKYTDIAQAMGEHVEGLSLYEAAEKSVNAVKRLLTTVNISFNLSFYGILKEDLPKLVEGGMKQSRLFVPNPRDLSEEDVRSIYEGAF